jgi:hypothetical protein
VNPAHNPRPLSVTVAGLLMLPVGATWATAGIAFTVGMMRDDGSFLAWALVIPILLLCLFLAYMSFVGAWQLYRGTSIKVLIPAYFTFAMFGLAIINLLVQGRISFSPTQILPLVVGVMAIVAHILVHRQSSMDWIRSQAVAR